MLQNNFSRRKFKQKILDFFYFKYYKWHFSKEKFPARKVLFNIFAVLVSLSVLFPTYREAYFLQYGLGPMVSLSLIFICILASVREN